MFRPHPRQALQPDQNTKHMPGKGRAESDRVIVPSACAASTRLRRIFSTRTSATAATLRRSGVIRCHVERGVHKHAALMLPIVERGRLTISTKKASTASPGARASQRRMRSATPPSTLVFEGSLIERPLVSERVVEAGASDPGFLDQVANRRRFVAEAAAADRCHL